MLLEELQTYLKNRGINAVRATDFEGREIRLVCGTGERVHLSVNGEMSVEKGRDAKVYSLIVDWIKRNRELVEETRRILESQPEDQGIRLRVDVYLPDANPEVEFQRLEQIRNSVGEFLDCFGFSPDPSAHSVERFSSWRWLEWFRSKTAKEEATEIYEGMKESLRREFIDKTGAEAFEKRANATAGLMESLKDYDRAIVRLGDVVVAKAMIDGIQQVVVETLSPQIARELERKPELLKNPEAFIQHVSVAEPNSVESETEVTPRLETEVEPEKPR